MILSQQIMIQVCITHYIRKNGHIILTFVCSFIRIVCILCEFLPERIQLGIEAKYSMEFDSIQIDFIREANCGPEVEYHLNQMARLHAFANNHEVKAVGLD